MKIIGLDSAVQESNIGLVLCDYTNGILRLEEKKNKDLSTEEQLALWINSAKEVILGVDSPLGWPARFAPSLFQHRAGALIDATPESFFQRETDGMIYQTLGKKPLEVGSDRIARTAFFTLKRLNNVNTKIIKKLKLLWEPKQNQNGFIEVYPAATLMANNLNIRNYKNTKSIREKLIEQLLGIYLIQLSDNIDIVTVDHDFDAFVCCIAVTDFINSRVIFPANIDEKIKTEGWIWVKNKFT